ncbi:hypothetical protein HMPREF2676_00725 [Staphylococcus sp. HMSC036A09]|jgi:hypothetical protein|uniref:hypothetical protein n=1 Tax=Staphylococcus TaxID=1279 RepID=UPI0008AA53DC|nr:MULTISPECIES: hypothetical protein [Staphylococcus]DAN50772.1 MAG TPA: MORN repeat-containing protein 4, Myosin-IIIa BINDING, PROTEIN TRANSPORT, MOTOR [Bacteriophage sp.]MBC2923400.1 hypothetical protein [Staphylococcus epidermidis]MBC2927772.1 hypothetical protein [Staphylococcus epidermidis]MBC2938852.1 hypothetical protein [Staphylococcus epidermidis]MBC2943157.1 hypothetical protein [Staphylococcus epidermidis]
MKTLSKEQTKNIMYQLYADRIGSKENLTFDERFNRDRAIIKVLFERWGMEPEENDKLAGSLALMYRRVFKTYGDVRNLLDAMDGDMQNLAKFSREDDLNDLFLLQKSINELIEKIKEQHEDYIIFYK